MKASEILKAHPNIFSVCDQSQVLTKVVLEFIEALLSNLLSELNSEDAWFDHWSKPYFESLNSEKLHL